MWMTTQEADGFVEHASAAPSVLNTQPWRFAERRSGIDLYADRTRQLLALDPSGRQLTVSCGAALFNLRMAILASYRTPEVSLLPDPSDRDLLARVQFGPTCSPTPEEWEL